MIPSAKAKRTPGMSRHEDPRKRPLRKVDPNEFRKIAPRVFIGKITLMSALLAVFGLGVISANSSVKLACAALTALPPLACGVEWLVTGRRSWLKALTQLVTMTIASLTLLTVAVVAPTLSCQFAIGAMLAHGTELAHQALHKTGTGKASIDRPIGFILCGATLVSFTYYLWSHLRHHKYNGTENDRESFAYAYELLDSPSRSWRLIGFIMHVTLVGHYFLAVRRLALAVGGQLRRRLVAEHPDMSDRVAEKIQRESRVQALILSGVALASVAFHTTAPLMLWIIPLLIGWGPVHSLVELTEHWDCDIPNADVFHNTRSLQATLFARWFTNFNNCHVGHHHDMSVPADNLPAYEKALAASNEFRHIEDSYPRFYLRFLRQLWTGRPSPGYSLAS